MCSSEEEKNLKNKFKYKENCKEKKLILKKNIDSFIFKFQHVFEKKNCL